MKESKLLGNYANIDLATKEIELPSGRSAIIKESTGIVEKSLTKKVNNNPDSFFDAVKSYGVACTESIDGKPATLEVIENLLPGDFDVLLLQIRCLSFTDKLEFSLACAEKNCGHKGNYSMHIQESLDKCEPYPDGDQREFSIDLGKGEVKWTMPTVKEQSRVANSSRGITDLLKVANPREEHGSQSIPLPLDVLPGKYLDKLKNHLKSKLYDLDTSIELECEKCGKNYQYDLKQVPAFFFPSMA